MDSSMASMKRDQQLAAHFVAQLVVEGATERSAGIFVELRGIGGEEPKSLRGVSRGLSAERIRQLVLELETGALRGLLHSTSDSAKQLSEDVQALLSVIAQHAPGSDETVRDSLERAGVHLQSPASVLRLADILGCNHEMRLTGWAARAKYKDGPSRQLAAYEDEPRRVSVTAIVPAAMPEVFENFINFARKFSRGAGVVAAGNLADRYSQERGVAVTQSEAVAFLTPFAVHLGRHDGDDWFAFFNSANDFLRKASARVMLFGHCSFELLCEFHRRYNRSTYASDDTKIPASVLRAAIELAGFTVDGDVVTPNANGETTSGAGRGASEMQTRMVRIFLDTLKGAGGRKSVARGEFVAAMLKAGIREATAYIYLSNQGIFQCKKGMVRLADELEAEGDSPAAGTKKAVKPKTSAGPKVSQAAAAD
jgi:hypothetical protein